MKQKRNILEALNNKRLRQRVLLISLTASFFLIPLFVFAALVPCGSIDESAPCTFCHFFQLIQNVYNFLVFYIVPPLAIAFVAVGGFIWFTSGGSQGRAQMAMKILQAVLIGLIVAYTSWLIVNFIITLLARTDIEQYKPAKWYDPTSWFTVQCKEVKFFCSIDEFFTPYGIIEECNANCPGGTCNPK